VAVLSYESKRISSIKLHPIDLALRLPRNQRGRPVLAKPGSEIYRSVISRYQRMSEAFGTVISKEGVVSIPK